MEDLNNHGFFAPKGPSFIQPHRVPVQNSSQSNTGGGGGSPTTGPLQQQQSPPRQQQQQQQHQIPEKTMSYHDISNYHHYFRSSGGTALPPPGSRFGFPQQQFSQRPPVNTHFFSAGQFGNIQRGNLIHGLRGSSYPYSIRPASAPMIEAFNWGIPPGPPLDPSKLVQVYKPSRGAPQSYHPSSPRVLTDNITHQQQQQHQQQQANSLGAMRQDQSSSSSGRCIYLEDCGGGDGGSSGMVFGVSTKQAQQQLQSTTSQSQQKQQFSRSSGEVSPSSTTSLNKKKRPGPTQIPIQALVQNEELEERSSAAERAPTPVNNSNSTTPWKGADDITDEDRFVKEFPDLHEANRQLQSGRQSVNTASSANPDPPVYNNTKVYEQQQHGSKNLPEQQQQPQEQQNAAGEVSEEPHESKDINAVLNQDYVSSEDYNRAYQQQQQQQQQQNQCNEESNYMFYDMRCKVRDGLNQFRNDFPSDSDETIPFKEEEKTKLPVTLPPAEFVPDFFCKDVSFDVDERVLIDPRPIIRWQELDENQREFKLFEDHSTSDLMKKVYNVNVMDLNPWEICGKKMLPQNVKKWPVQMIAFDNDRELRKDLLLLRNPSGAPPTEVYDPLGPYGLRTLTKSTNWEGAEETPFSFITFMGMNLNKVVRGLDQSRMMIQTFAGPLAMHNHSLGYDSVTARSSLVEYDIPADPEINRIISISHAHFDKMDFSTLAFIFYNIFSDGLQLLAAKTLNKRGWAFHKLYQVWIRPLKDAERILQSHGGGGEPISFDLVRKELEKCFDPSLVSDDESYWKSEYYVYFNYDSWGFECTRLNIRDGVLETKAPPVNGALFGF